MLRRLRCNGRLIIRVHRILNAEYPPVLFFHCSSHVLNLVMNDLNDVSEVRDTTGTTKAVIIFFRESTLQRNNIPNLGNALDTECCVVTCRQSAEFAIVCNSDLQAKNCLQKNNPPMTDVRYRGLGDLSGCLLWSY